MNTIYSGIHKEYTTRCCVVQWITHSEGRAPKAGNRQTTENQVFYAWFFIQYRRLLPQILYKTFERLYLSRCEMNFRSFFLDFLKRLLYA